MQSTVQRQVFYELRKMKPTIEIICPEDPGDVGYSRYMNFLESVDLCLKDTELGRITNKIGNIDNYGDGEFTVEIFSKRHIGEIRALIRKELRKHNLTHDLIVVRGGQ